MNAREHADKWGYYHNGSSVHYYLGSHPAIRLQVRTMGTPDDDGVYPWVTSITIGGDADGNGGLTLSRAEAGQLAAVLQLYAVTFERERAEDLRLRQSNANWAAQQREKAAAKRAEKKAAKAREEEPRG